jgi:hypothetical protein
MRKPSRFGASSGAHSLTPVIGGERMGSLSTGRQARTNRTQPSTDTPTFETPKYKRLEYVPGQYFVRIHPEAVRPHRHLLASGGGLAVMCAYPSEREAARSTRAECANGANSSFSWRNRTADLRPVRKSRSTRLCFHRTFTVAEDLRPPSLRILGWRTDRLAPLRTARANPAPPQTTAARPERAPRGLVGKRLQSVRSDSAEAFEGVHLRPE